MRTSVSAIALALALALPAQAAKVSVTIDLKEYGGDGAYLALYVVDAQGAYVGSLWAAGRKSKYYKHFDDWKALSGNAKADFDGVTGASVGAGRRLVVDLDLADAVLAAGYSLHVDASVEDMPDSPSEVVIPLSPASAGREVAGGRYIRSLRLTM